MASSGYPFFKSIGIFISRTISRFVLWLYSGVFTLMLTIVGSLMYRERMSHNNGVGAAGSLRIVPDPQFPPHPFFEPGKTYPCRIRHAAASFLDDAMRVVRSMSIKFADTRFASPLDLELNTGEVALFWSAASFLRFAKYKKTAYGIQYHQYYRNYPAGVRGAHAGMRRNPTSFSNLRFYGQTPFLYVGADQVKRYAKYRAVPAEDVPETGILDAYDRSIPTENQRILPGETLSRNYLKEEYKHRLSQGPVRYKLQIQLHTASDDDTAEIFNCCREWEEASHPWMDLADIQIGRALDWRESCLMAFSVGNMPKGLGVIPAKSIFDYNSLNYMRLHSEMARRARTFMIRTFGIPPEIPSDDNRNV